MQSTIFVQVLNFIIQYLKHFKLTIYFFSYDTESLNRSLFSNLTTDGSLIEGDEFLSQFQDHTTKKHTFGVQQLYTIGKKNHFVKTSKQ
jgi:hypothetical protein